MQSSQVARLLTTQLSGGLLGPGSWHTKHFRNNGGDLGEILLKAEKQADRTLTRASRVLSSMLGALTHVVSFVTKK